MTAPATGAVLWFEEDDCRRTELAGGKGASLASMSCSGLPVPPGFLVPAAALEEALAAAGLHGEVRETLNAIRDEEDVGPAAETLQALVHRAPVSGSLATAVVEAYERLDADGARVAVRSSACAEDGEVASYAGQQETYLNVSGGDEVLRFVNACWASFFGARALFYRRLKGSLTDLGMAVVVQRQLDAEKAGVMFTIDPVRRRRDQMLVEAVWGLGEAVVSGAVIPDQYLLTRTGQVKKVQVANQEMMVVRGADGGTEESAVDPALGSSRVLDDSELASLAELGIRAESVFGGPQDIEWAFEDSRLYLLQSRPVTA